MNIDSITSIMVEGWAKIEAIDTMCSPCSTLGRRFINNDAGT